MAVQLSMRRQLEKADYRVEITGTGDRALKAFRSHSEEGDRVDLLIADLGVPGMDVVEQSAPWVCEELLVSVWIALLHANSSHPRACPFLPLQAKQKVVNCSSLKTGEKNLDNL